MFGPTEMILLLICGGLILLCFVIFIALNTLLKRRKSSTNHSIIDPKIAFIDAVDRCFASGLEPKELASIMRERYVKNNQSKIQQQIQLEKA